jgi:hypothetical protein
MDYSGAGTRTRNLELIRPTLSPIELRRFAVTRERRIRKDVSSSVKRRATKLPAQPLKVVGE